MSTIITDVQPFLVNPLTKDMVIVKVETNQPGLYGLGCATYAPRVLSVKTALEEVKHVVIGRDVSQIEDIWQQMFNSSYWRNGPILNNAISGIDMALWDIKGKMANMPVYDLLGGKVRKGVRMFGDAFGDDFATIQAEVQKRLDEGFDHIRLFYNGDNTSIKTQSPQQADWGIYRDSRKYINNMVYLFHFLREKFGDEPEFMIDVHERLSPTETITLAKALEPYHPFFLEDSLMPEQVDWFKNLRMATSTPLAMGELFNNVNEYKDLIAHHEIDYIRCHISHLGGITPAKKLMNLCEFYGIRTIWHGPDDISPIGMAAQIHLDLSSITGIMQEFRPYKELMYEIFPGAPVLKDTYLYVNDKPGLGVDFNEELAKQYPPKGYDYPKNSHRDIDGSPKRG